MRKAFSMFAMAAVAAFGLADSATAQLTGSPPISAQSTTLNFRNVTATNIVQTQGEITNNEKEVEFADYDNDGDLDASIAVALSDFTERRNKLYRNDNGVMTEVTAAVIPGYLTLEVTRNTFFRDYDGDGWKDLITVSDSNNGPGGITKYYRNNHPGGVFSNFVEETGRLNGAAGAACSSVSFDFDGDGDDDLYLGNYPFNSQDTMYFNDGTGNFTEVTNSNVPTELDYTTDVAAADINNDGRLDLLVASSFGDPDYIYYNNLNGNGSGDGDYKYSGSTWLVPNSTGNGETSMEPGDFNGDGKVDIYFSNRTSFNDVIMINQGNDGSGKATFVEQTMPGPVSNSRSAKATVADLNKDGRPDVIVMGEGRRPYIFRNTSVGGNVSFVDWTPASAFPSSSIHAGWHAGAFDADGDRKVDIMVGGTNDDHLFLNTKSNEVKEKGLSAANLPTFYNTDPVAVIGAAAAGSTKSYVANNIPSNAEISVVLRSRGDVELVIRNASNNVVASSDRGGAGVEEAVQFTGGGTLTFEVRMNSGKSSPPFTLEVLARD